MGIADSRLSVDDYREYLTELLNGEVDFETFREATGYAEYSLENNSIVVAFRDADGYTIFDEGSEGGGTFDIYVRDEGL